MIHRLASLCMLLVTACGGTSAGLDLHFDAQASSWRDIVQRLATAPAAPESDVVFAISATVPPMLTAVNDAGQIQWQSETMADAVIHVAGRSVLVVEDGSLVARDSASGQRTFTRSLGGMSLLGVTGEGDTLAWVSATPSITATEPISNIAVVDAQTGRVRWERTISAALGSPLLRNDVLIVPWNRQGLTAIDARNGHELARLHANHINVDWLDLANSGVIYGNEQIRDIACADASCEPLPSPFATAPSQPALHTSGYRAPIQSGIRTAYRVTRQTDGRMTFGDNRAYLIFYRFVFAYDATGALAWAQTLSHDVLDAHPFDGGLALLDTHGTHARLRATDGTWLVRSASNGAWRTARFSGQPSPLAEAERSVAAPAETLSNKLLEMVLDPDNRLLVARAYAVQELARDPDPQVTQQLLDAYEQRSTPAGLRATIAEALRSRRTGSEHLVTALARHHDFLDGVTPAPLSVVVPALVAMNERRAVPALIAHLHDPATSAEDLTVIADGLAQLGDRSLSTEITAWLRTYRSSAALASHPGAVIALARAAQHLSDPDAAIALNLIAQQSHTHPVLVAALNEVLTPPEPQVVASTTQAAANEVVQRLPHEPDQRTINAAFATRVDAIRACVAPELARNPTLSQVRIAFVARPNGSTHGFAFAPGGVGFASCLRPIVEGIELTPFDGKPKVASYVIQLRSTGPTPTANDAGADQPVAEWWSWYARETPPTDGSPWWSRYVEQDFAWLPVVASTPAPTGATPSAATPQVPTEAQPAEPQPTVEAPAEAPQATPQPAPTPPAASDDAWWLPPQP